MSLRVMCKSEDHNKGYISAKHGKKLESLLPFHVWLALPWLKERQKLPTLEDKKCCPVDALGKMSNPFHN